MIAGIGNFAPVGRAKVVDAASVLTIDQRSLRKLYELADKAASTRDAKDIAAAQALQVLLAEGDFAVGVSQHCVVLTPEQTTKLHIPGAKRILEDTRGYGGLPREPIRPVDERLYAEIMKSPGAAALMDLEKQLENEYQAANQASPEAEAVGATKELQETIRYGRAMCPFI